MAITIIHFCTIFTFKIMPGSPITGVHMTTTMLSYKPTWGIYDSTCNSKFIFVKESSSMRLYIHLWDISDQSVECWDKQQLGLGKDESISRMACGHGDLLHMSVWDTSTVKYRIITYQVRIRPCLHLRLFSWQPWVSEIL